MLNGIQKSRSGQKSKHSSCPTPPVQPIVPVSSVNAISHFAISGKGPQVPSQPGMKNKASKMQSSHLCLRIIKSQLSLINTQNAHSVIIRPDVSYLQIWGAQKNEFKHNFWSRRRGRCPRYHYQLLAYNLKLFLLNQIINKPEMKNNWKELNQTKGRKEDLLQGYNLHARFLLLYIWNPRPPVPY